MCIARTSKPQMALAPAEIADPVMSVQDMFPDPERPVWEQFWSERHRQLYESRSSVQSDSEVFRIFQRANFSRLSKIDGLRKPIDTFLDPNHTIPQLWYDRMLPALALATRLIKATPLFFYTIAFGTIGHFEDGSLGYARDKEGNWLYHLEEGADLDSKVQEMFRRMSNIQFFTGYAPENIDYAFGHASSSFYPQGQPGRQLASSAVQLHTKWIAFFSRRDYDDIPEDVKNRLLVLLAIVLVHELVHVLYGYRKFEHARKGNITRWLSLETQEDKAGAVHGKEPYFFSDEEAPELGLAWERYAFNGEAKLDWSEGFCYSQSSLLMLHPCGREGEATEPEGSKFAPVIDPGLVWAFLSKDCWGLYNKMKAHSSHSEQVETLELFAKMEKVFALRTFTEGIGRSPSPAELGQQLVDGMLISRRTVDDIHQSAMRTWLPPTPPPTPPPHPPPTRRKPRKPRAAAGRMKWTDILVYSGSKLEKVITLER